MLLGYVQTGRNIAVFTSIIAATINIDCKLRILSGFPPRLINYASTKQILVILR